MDSRFIPYGWNIFRDVRKDATPDAGPRGGGRAEPCASSPRRERNGGTHGYAWDRRRIAGSKGRRDQKTLLCNISMGFFSFIDLRNISQSRGEGVASAPLRHSSVVVRRGGRRFRYNRPENAAPSGDPHSPTPLSPILPPALTGERGLQSPSLSVFLPLLPSGREAG